MRVLDPAAQRVAFNTAREQEEYGYQIKLIPGLI